jgi:hypothetical protein
MLMVIAWWRIRSRGDGPVPEDVAPAPEALVLVKTLGSGCTTGPGVLPVWWKLHDSVMLG